MSKEEHKNKFSLGTILFTVFLDLLGIGIIIPIVAPTILKTDILGIDASFSYKTLILGLLISSYPIAQFFSAPVLGAMSDRDGRKKILIFSIIGSVIGYLIFALGIIYNNISMLFMGRIVDGISGGNIAIIYSSLADVSDEKSKAKNFGLVGAAFGVGFIIGPFFGGELANPNLVSWFNYSTPFFFAALLSFINLIMVIIRFKETLKEKRETEINIFTGFKNISKAMSIKDFRNIFFIAFLVTFGFTMFSQFFQVFLIEKFNYSQFNIGRLLAYFGICSALIQGGLVRRLSKKHKPEKILPISLFLMSISLILLIIPNESWYLYITMALVAITQGITSPNITAMVSNLADNSTQGEVLGINQSVQALAQAIPPIIGGLTVSLNLNTPIILSAIVVFIAWITFINVFMKKKA
jgi:DHA1 family tetracycline resistance protein-like MFS transporter